MDPTFQLALSMGVPTLAILVGILVNNSRLSDLNSRLADVRTDVSGQIRDLRTYMDVRFDAVDSRFDGVADRFDGVAERFDRVDQRLDDMKELWRSELRRVEEINDARLKHLEERRRA